MIHDPGKEAQKFSKEALAPGRTNRTANAGRRIQPRFVSFCSVQISKFVGQTSGLGAFSKRQVARTISAKEG
jgi:hypothetical protein